MSLPRAEPHRAGSDAAPRRLHVALGAALVALVALLARIVPLVRGGGLTGVNNYDDGVNFGGSLGLVHGRLPYRDFLWLHPPGIQLALAPFAALSLAVGERDAFVLARLAWIGLGALTAVLIGLLLLPAGRVGAAFGALLYAVFWPALVSTQTVRLEGLTSLLLIAALLLLRRTTRRPELSTATVVIAGLLLGFSTTVKIWGVVAVLIVAAWLGWRDGWRRGLQLAGGAAISCAPVCLPFFLADPANMWRMVVLDQLGRSREDGIGPRLAHLTSVSPIDAGWSPVLIVILALLAASAVLAWRVAEAQPAVLLLIGFVMLLMTTPTWFFHYGGLTAPVIAVVAGAGVQRLMGLPWIRRRALTRRGVAIAAFGSLLLPAAFAAHLTEGEPFPHREVEAALAGSRTCVTADHPTALILTDRVGRNIDQGCPLVIDLGGYSHDLQRGKGLSRKANRDFQDFALRYLASGDRALLVRFGADSGWSRTSYRVLQSWPVLYEFGERGVRRPSP